MNVMKDWLRHLLGRRYLSFIDRYYAIRYWLLYRGSQYVCPCCSARLKCFLERTTPLGTRSAAVICPRCDSHPRHRLLWLFFHAQCRELFEKRLQLLHLAPEFCFERHFRRIPNLQYVTGDLASPHVDYRVDVCCLPFAVNQFDVILCNHVLEHVPADQIAISEIFRVLRPGGWALMQVPIDQSLATTFENPEIRTSEQRELHYGQDDHVRQYGLDFVDRIRQAGFCADVIDFVAKQDPGLIRYHGLPAQELIYFCRKPGVQEQVA